jgi:hypothetical protein
MFIEKIGPSKDLLHSLLHAFHVYQSIIGADLLGCVNSVRKQRKLSAISVSSILYSLNYFLRALTKMNTKVKEN